MASTALRADHVFHGHCISRWLKTKNNCALCAYRACALVRCGRVGGLRKWWRSRLRVVRVEGRAGSVDWEVQKIGH